MKEEYDPTKKYCPFCQRVIVASNIEDAESGEAEDYVFVHDDVPHDPDWKFEGFDS